MRLNRTLALSVALTTLATPAFAQFNPEPDIFGRTGRYDLTGRPEVAGIRIDQRFVTGDGPSFQELKGLAGAPIVQVRRNFLYVEDADRTLNVPARSGRDLGEYFNFAAQELYRAFPDEFVFFILFTTFDARVGAFFYSPEANDTRGLASMIFDSNGSSPREGIVFMNYYLALDEQYRQLGAAAIAAQRRAVFNQEVGHRWGAFTTLGATDTGGGTDVLLGRDEGHWSFFMHSNASPMEGNSWRDNNNGTFTTTTDLDNFTYNDLDLYLMGLMDPAEAAPWFVITDPDVGNQQDLFGQVINPASPPHIISGFRGNAITISGTRVDQDAEMVARRHGRRVPSHVEAPRTFRTAFVLLATPSTAANDSVLGQFEGMVDDYASGWATGTRNLASLDYILMDTPLTPIGGVCTEPAECDPQDAPICIAIPADTAAICTRPCDTADTCPTDWCCKSLGAGSASVCATGDICIEPEPEPEPLPNACACNLTSGACDANCTCDTECGFVDGICSCDLTTACDASTGGGDCLCDPECPGESGCACTATETTQKGGALLFAALLLGLVIRRRAAR